MATLQPVQGQTNKQAGQGSNISSGEFQEMLVTELQPRYYEQTYRGLTFQLGTTAAGGTAYVGAAGGTPLLGVWNPTGSGKNLVLLNASLAVVAQASATGCTQFRLYAGPTAAITQATTQTPFNLGTLTKSGSVATGFANQALTSSTALTYVDTIGTYAFSVQLTSGGPTYMLAPCFKDFSGQIIVPPGNMIAIGAVTIPTSMTNDASLSWIEVAI